MGEGATNYSNSSSLFLFHPFFFLPPSFYLIHVPLPSNLLITLMVLESLLLAITTRMSGELKGENNKAY